MTASSSARLGPYRFAGGNAVVTGAAGGIGRALAIELAQRGSSLVLLDRDADGLAALSGELRARHPGIGVDTLVVDLADDEATTRAAARVRGDHPRITLLANNAGVALNGRFEQLDVEEFDWVLAVNLHAPVRLTSELLPVLRLSPGSHVVNTSSLFGLVAPSGQTAYAASKFAVRGFSEALRVELAPLRIGVTCVHPGGVDTDIARNARMGRDVDAVQARATQESFQRLFRTSAHDAATTILEGVRRRRARVLVGRDAKVTDLLARAAPTAFPFLLDLGTRALLHRGRR